MGHAASVSYRRLVRFHRLPAQDQPVDVPMQSQQQQQQQHVGGRPRMLSRISRIAVLDRPVRRACGGHQPDA